MAFSMTASAVAIATAGGVPVKLHMHRKTEVEVRRIPAPSSFDELITVVTHLWGGSAGKRLVIEYVDDEGDRVQMSSAWEWDECLRLFRELQPRPGAPLVLHATRRKGPQRAARPAGADGVSLAMAATAADSSSDDESTVTVSANRLSGGGSFVGGVARTTAPAPQPTVAPAPAPVGASQPPVSVSPAAKPVVPPVDLTRTVPALPPSPNPVRSARLSNTPDDMQSATIQLLSNLFNCDAENVLCDPGTAAHAMAGVVVARRAGGVNDEVHVDIDRAALRRQSCGEGNRRIQHCEHARAETLIKLACKVFPNDETLLYNLACATARQAKVDEAFKALRDAINAGYDNAEHAQRDTDLISLRGDPRFNVFIRVMKKDPTAQLPAETPAATTTPVPPPVATPVVTTPRTANAKSLVEMFPSLSVADARNLLIAHDNDVSKAVNAFLRSGAV